MTLAWIWDKHRRTILQKSWQTTHELVDTSLDEHSLETSFQMDHALVDVSVNEQSLLVKKMLQCLRMAHAKVRCLHCLTCLTRFLLPFLLVFTACDVWFGLGHFPSTIVDERC